MHTLKRAFVLFVGASVAAIGLGVATPAGAASRPCTPSEEQLATIAQQLATAIGSLPPTTGANFAADLFRDLGTRFGTATFVFHVDENTANRTIVDWLDAVAGACGR